MFKNIVKIIIIGISIYLYGIYNIYNYSVYYAKHMPYGEDRDLMIMEFVDNLTLQFLSDKADVDYDIDGTHALRKKHSIGIPLIGNGYDNEYGRTYLYISQLEEYFKFDNKFNVVYARDRKFNHISENLIDEKELKNEIYNNFKGAIENHHVPTVNLQWVYNLINQDRINYMTNKLSE